MSRGYLDPQAALIDSCASNILLRRRHLSASSRPVGDISIPPPPPPPNQHPHKPSKMSSLQSAPSDRVGPQPYLLVPNLHITDPSAHEVDLGSHPWMVATVIEDDDLMFGGKPLSTWYEEERRRLSSSGSNEEEERRGRQRERVRIESQHHHHHHQQHKQHQHQHQHQHSKKAIDAK